MFRKISCTTTRLDAPDCTSGATARCFHVTIPQLGAPIRTAIDNQFVAAGVAPPAPVIESTSTRINFEVVRGTDTIGVMTEDAAVIYRRSGTLAILNVKFAARLPYVGVVTRTARVSNAVTTFLTVLRAECGAFKR